jgi:hypothetical protein
MNTLSRVRFEGGMTWRPRGPRALLSLVCFVAAMGCGGGDTGTVDAGLDAEGLEDATTDAADANQPDAATCEDTDSCPPPTCTDLFLSGECPEHRACMDLVGGGLCLESCESGFEFNPGTGTCESCALVDCGPAPTCDVGVPGSIADMCDDLHRVCDAELATCGACDAEAGFMFDDTSGECVRSCASHVCDDGFHAEVDADACVCVANTCPAGQAQVLGAVPFRCTGSQGTPACTLTCSGQGENGVYPTTDEGGHCVCNTEEAYFWSSTHNAARRCDVDGDVWINRSAWREYTSADQTYRDIALAGCGLQLQRVDRVELENEYVQTKTIYVCGNGLFEQPCQAEHGGASSMPLVEADASDIAGTPNLPAPGGGTRRLTAAQLNATTKACVTSTADFDGDTVPDVEHAQVATTSTDRADWWAQFAFFVELHTSQFIEPTMLESSGRFVITERSRASASFPMRYLGTTPGEYWRQCSRQTDARYFEGSTDAGFDFARWSPRGTPVVPAPPIASTPGVNAPPAPHGLSDIVTPWGGAWRGMTHHSQFRCAVVGAGGYPAEAFGPTASGGYLDFQTCTAGAGTPAPFTCTTQSEPASNLSAGWAAVRYSDAPSTPGGAPSNEVYGCVDETIWRASAPSICPSDTPTDLQGHPEQSSDPNDFGQLICACDARDPVRNPSLPDPVDNAFIDSNCDGMDGNAAQLVFVAVDGNDASGCGTRQSPCRTINRGVSVANGAGFDVVVSQGTYNERVVVVNGVSVHGGYSRSNGWARSSTFETRIAGTSVTGSFVESVYAENIVEPTELDHFVIETASAPAGQAGISVYGIRVRNASSLVLAHLDVSVGQGSSGFTGGTGGNGSRGNDGSGASGGSQGAGAAPSACSNGGGNGGNGGGDQYPAACGTGAPGQGHGGSGASGGGGGGGGGASANSCAGSKRNADNGNGGAGGAGGGNGAPASANASVGSTASFTWNVSNGNGNGTGGGAGRAGGASSPSAAPRTASTPR